jgi:hypothetical protein
MFLLLLLLLLLLLYQLFDHRGGVILVPPVSMASTNAEVMQMLAWPWKATIQRGECRQFTTRGSICGMRIHAHNVDVHGKRLHTLFGFPCFPM